MSEKKQNLTTDPRRPDDPALYLAGPTGCGKTRVSVALARLVERVEIINADAFQIYRGLETLTAAPSESEQCGIPHRGFGILDVSEECDAAQFAERTHRLISEAASVGALPIVVGGSGLYLKAITHGLADTPPGDPALRAELDKLTLTELVQQLQKVDPAGAEVTNLKNRRYVTRNLEISILTGRPASEVKREFAKNDPKIRGIYLSRSREELCERINARTLQMFEAGVVEEVMRLNGLRISATAEKAIGFREIRALIDGEMTEPGCIEVIQQATRRYAKRQATWFKREKAFQTVCIEPNETAESAASRIVELFPELIPDA